MDTIVFVITMIGASLATALLFASTVLSYKWWNLPLIHRHHKNKDSQQKRQGSNSELIPQHKVVEVKLVTDAVKQTLYEEYLHQAYSGK